MELLIVTGMSGAGKSQAADVMEDIGIYCADNVPPMLIVSIVKLPQRWNMLDKIALVVDVRSRDMFADLHTCFEELESMGIDYKILFLDCSDEVLARRYKETRRRHPLQDKPGKAIADAIAEERVILADLRRRASYVMDSSALSAIQLRAHVRDMFADNEDGRMLINCVSFGFKNGLPTDADLVFDLRCLPNPHYVPELRAMTGLEEPIQNFLNEHHEVIAFREKLFDMLDFLVPLYIAEGKSQLIVAIGCTGGKHRSVAFAEWLTQHMRDSGQRVNVLHRDILRG